MSVNWRNVASKTASFAPWAGLAVPFALYVATLLRHVANVPYYDDYKAVLSFLLSYAGEQSLLGRLALVLSQHNEHRIVMDRLATLAYYHLCHRANFSFLVLFGNLGWMVATAILVWYGLRRLRLPAAYLLPVPFLLLSFVEWDLMFWPMSSVQNYWCIVFALLFLIALSGGKTWLCCLLFPAALFTSGGGILLYPLGNGYLLLMRRWKHAAWFAAISTLFAALYFVGYQEPANSPSTEYALVHPMGAAEYLFTFWGDMFSPWEISLYAGLVLAALSLLFILRRRSDVFLRLLLGFVALSAATAAVTRSAFGLLQATAPRYILFSLLCAVSLVLLTLSAFPKPGRLRTWAAILLVLFSIAYWWDSYVRSEIHGRFRDMREARVAGMRAYAAGKPGGLCLHKQERAEQILEEARKAGIYDYKAEKF